MSEPSTQTYGLDIFEVSARGDDSEPIAAVSLGHHDRAAFCAAYGHGCEPEDVLYEWWVEEESDDSEMTFVYNVVSDNGDGMFPTAAFPVTVLPV